MTYEELIKELCDVIKEGEANSVNIYDNLEKIDNNINSLNIPQHEAKKITNLISDCFGILQNQDLHRQKIERVVNYVSEEKQIDISEYNISSSAKFIQGDSSEVVSDDELEALIKSMKA